MGDKNFRNIGCQDIYVIADVTCDNIQVATNCGITGDCNIEGEFTVGTNINPFTTLTPLNNGVLTLNSTANTLSWSANTEAGQIDSGLNINITENNSVYTINTITNPIFDDLTVGSVDYLTSYGSSNQVLMTNSTADGLIWGESSSAGITNIESSDLGVSIDNNVATVNLEVQNSVTPASYTNSNITVSSKGIITAISNGSSASLSGTENQIDITDDVISLANPIIMNGLNINTTNNLITLTENDDSNQSVIAPDSVTVKSLDNNVTTDQCIIQSNSIILQDIGSGIESSLTNVSLNISDVNVQNIVVKNSQGTTLYTLPNSNPSPNQVLFNNAQDVLTWTSLSDNGITSISSSDNDLDILVVSENADINLKPQTITDSVCSFGTVTINSKGIVTEAVSNTINSTNTNIDVEYANNNLTIGLNSNLTDMVEVSFQQLNGVQTTLDGDSLIIEDASQQSQVIVTNSSVSVQNTQSSQQTDITSGEVNSTTCNIQNINVVNSSNVKQYQLPQTLGTSNQILAVPISGTTLTWITQSAVEETITQGANIVITNQAPNSITIALDNDIVLTNTGSLTITSSVINDTSMTTDNIIANETLKVGTGSTYYYMPTAIGTNNQVITCNSSNQLIWETPSTVQETIDEGSNIIITTPTSDTITIAVSDNIDLTSQGGINIDTGACVLNVNSLTINDGGGNIVTINPENSNFMNATIENQLFLGNTLGVYTLPISTGDAGQFLALGSNAIDVEWKSISDVGITSVLGGANINATLDPIDSSIVTVSLFDQLELTTSGNVTIGDQNNNSVLSNVSLIIQSDIDNVVQSNTITDQSIALESQTHDIKIGYGGNNNVIVNDNDVQKSTLSNISINIIDNTDQEFPLGSTLNAGNLTISQLAKTSSTTYNTLTIADNTDPGNVLSNIITNNGMVVQGGSDLLANYQLESMLIQNTTTGRECLINAESINCVNATHELITIIGGDPITPQYSLPYTTNGVSTGDVLSFNGVGQPLQFLPLSNFEQLTRTVSMNFTLGNDSLTTDVYLYKLGNIVSGYIDISSFSLKDTGSTTLYSIDGSVTMADTVFLPKDFNSIQVACSSINFNNLTGIGLAYSGNTRADMIVDSVSTGNTLIFGFTCTYNVSGFFEFLPNVTYDLSRLYYGPSTYDPKSKLYFSYVGND